MKITSDRVRYLVSIAIVLAMLIAALIGIGLARAGVPGW